MPLAVSAGRIGRPATTRFQRFRSTGQNAIRRGPHILLWARCSPERERVEFPRMEADGGDPQGRKTDARDRRQALQYALVKAGSAPACRPALGENRQSTMQSLEAEVLVLEIAQRARNSPAPTEVEGKTRFARSPSALGRQRLVRPPLPAAVRVVAFIAGVAEARPRAMRGRTESKPAKIDTPSVNNKNGRVR